MTSCLFNLHIERSDWKLDQLHNYHPTGTTAKAVRPLVEVKILVKPPLLKRTK